MTSLKNLFVCLAYFTPVCFAANSAFQAIEEQSGSRSSSLGLVHKKDALSPHLSSESGDSGGVTPAKSPTSDPLKPLLSPQENLVHMVLYPTAVMHHTSSYIDLLSPRSSSKNDDVGYEGGREEDGGETPLKSQKGNEDLPSSRNSIIARKPSPKIAPSKRHQTPEPTKVDLNDNNIRSITPPPSSSNTTFFSSQESVMRITLAAIAYEAYQSNSNEVFQKPLKSPKEWLKQMGFDVECQKNENYILVKDDVQKLGYIAFAGTGTNNFGVSMGSCLFWEKEQYDSTGKAILPRFISCFTNKPYTHLMYAAFTVSVYYFTQMCWQLCTQGDVFYSASLAVGAFVFGMAMYKNLFPWIAFPNYMKHIKELEEKIKPVHSNLVKNGYQVSFVGHSLGGHIAQIMAAFFKDSKAYSFSAPGGGFVQSLVLTGLFKSKHGRDVSFVSQEELESRIFRYGIKGDPIISLKHEHDPNTMLDTIETDNKRNGLTLHRISEIYRRFLGGYYEELHRSNMSGAH